MSGLLAQPPECFVLARVSFGHCGRGPPSTPHTANRLISRAVIFARGFVEKRWTG